MKQTISFKKLNSNGTMSTSNLIKGCIYFVPKTGLIHVATSESEYNTFGPEIIIKETEGTESASIKMGDTTYSLKYVNTWRPITDSVETNDSNTAASATAVKSVYDITINKQDTLVSGSNIKTINGQSILGDGDITISRSYNDLTDKPTIPSAVTSSTVSEWGFTKNTGTVTGVKIDNGYTQSPVNGVVDLGYVNKQLSTSTSSSMTLYSNIYYRNTNTSLSTLTITLFGGGVSSNIMNEYFVEFTTSSAGTTVSFPSNIKWANGETPTFEASTTYQISIVNNLGVVQKFK